MSLARGIGPRAAILAGLGALAGCTAQPDSPLLNRALGQTTPGARAALAAEAQLIAQAGGALMTVSLQDRDQTATVVRAARNGGAATWLTPDGVSLTLRDGLVIASRGLGNDLMESDVGGILPLVLNLRDGGAQRRHAYLDGEQSLATATYACTIEVKGPREVPLTNKRTVAATLVQEDCAGAGTRFQNLYWVDVDGPTVVQSRQWLGGGIGDVALRIIPR